MAKADSRAVVRLSVDDLAVRFGGLYALKGVSAQISTGELVAVVGPNGAGKSTLLNAISGLVRANMTGTITVDGRRIDKMGIVARSGIGMGRSFQDPPLVGTLTVLENVLVGAERIHTYGLVSQIVRWRKVAAEESELSERARELLRFMQIEALASLPASSIAYGPRKLVDVARALMADPVILLLDEPSSGLDHAEQRTLTRILNDLQEEQRFAMVVVEHHMDLVRATATRVIGLQAGEVIANGPTREVLDSDEFRAALVR
jgi:branched-chain amino acid transport system ATP-binding protein